jgi:heme A synthase
VFAFGAVITTQLVLGITTLLLAVPVPLGVLHQFTGVLALTAALVATQRAMASGATVEVPREVVAARPARAAAPVETATAV